MSFFQTVIIVMVCYSTNTGKLEDILQEECLLMDQFYGKKFAFYSQLLTATYKSTSFVFVSLWCEDAFRMAW